MDKNWSYVSQMRVLWKPTSSKLQRMPTQASYHGDIQIYKSPRLSTEPDHRQVVAAHTGKTATLYYSTSAWTSTRIRRNIPLAVPPVNNGSAVLCNGLNYPVPFQYPSTFVSGYTSLVCQL